uniref:K Homology domain-containing protein n=1 Tax=Meloidogyne javanica TaxID=6303 RepID=A0A915MD99_MELJA
MSEEYKPDDSEINIQIGQKRQNNENGGPASKKANGGETMRNLKNDTGCRVQMSKNQEFYHGTTERICFVKGKISSAMIVMGAILEKIQEKVEGHHPSDPFDLKGLQRTNEMKFIVPNTSAGMVIGKNGTSIKEIRETTTANIQIYPKAGTEEAKMSLERVITIGHETNDVLMSAMQKVLERVSSGYDFATSRVTTGASQFAGMQPTPAWQNQTSIGTGNNELLAFLDNLQSTLRSSGFNDQSVSEVMQAMQVLAKYNIMGLGLGLGVAAMAQMRNSENAAVQQQNALIGVQNASMQQQRYDVMSHPQNANMMTGNSLMDAHNNSLDQNIGGAGGVLIDVMSQKKSGGVVSNAFANSIIKERILEDGRVELEVPDNIIGAVLGPRAKTLIEIQQLSGAKIEVHKRGSATTSPGGRLV